MGAVGLMVGQDGLSNGQGRAEGLEADGPAEGLTWGRTRATVSYGVLRKELEPMPSTPYSVRLDAELKSRLDAEAARLERPASWVLHQALVAYLDDKDAERRHLEALAAEADRGTFVSSAAMGRWVDSWDTAEELPPPEPDLVQPR